jgi:hypothetical protein
LKKVGASNSAALQSPLFPPREAFAQDEREYLVFDYFESESLQDYREPTNDERLLSMLSALANGLHELKKRSCVPNSRPKRYAWPTAGCFMSALWIRSQ